ncbi:hypothetical protein JG688_00007297 [Phytophthora aleatoria]|uniref:DUF4833 domain-containing protein n=1 Tax=Phytophthora aleatoria TaxID=2496075 RepID=A0A8J5J9X5_9STRA|nr:hypothetical protein JG688_00007297 [Phytophthora aleatoria]
MDAILARQAEKRLQKALAALRRALQVAEASRELHKSPLALVDESPNVSSMLSRVVSSCNEVGPITRKLHQAVSAPAAENDDANSSATEDEGDMPLHEIIDLDNERALPPVKKLTERELLEKRLALAPQGEFGEMVHSCLLAARDSLFSTSVSKLQSTCRELADAKDRGVSFASYMDNIQAVLTSMFPHLIDTQVPSERKELRRTLLLLQRLPREFPETAKLRRNIAANFETPAEEVVIIQERLKKMLKEVRGWCRDDPYSVGVFDDRLQFVKEIEASGYEGYEPRWDKTIAELLFRFGCSASRSVASSSMSGEHHAKHYFTEEFPDNDYQCTTESSHPQTPLWPAYLPVNQDRVVVFERSKNAQLVVYSASFRDKKRRELDPKWPLDINWQSFGWTAHPTSNSTGMVERRLAWGYSHKAVKPEDPVAVEAVGTSYTVTLNALPSRPSLLYVDAKGRVILQTTINGVPSRLWKIYVKTNNSIGFIPKVLYVDLHGTHIGDDHGTYERITISS